MKRTIGWVLGGTVGFLALCLMLPAQPQSEPALCGAGIDLRDATGGQMSDEEIHRIACDRDAAEAGYQALERRRFGE